MKMEEENKTVKKIMEEIKVRKQVARSLYHNPRLAYLYNIILGSGERHEK